MNSSRLRSAIEAPKLAITMMMTAPRRSRSRPNSSASSSERQHAGQRHRDERRDRQDQPKENGPIGASSPPNTEPSAPATASAR